MVCLLAGDHWLGAQGSVRAVGVGGERDIPKGAEGTNGWLEMPVATMQPPHLPLAEFRVQQIL